MAETNSIFALIGLEARISPTIFTTKEINGIGRLGPVHSANIQAVSGVWRNDISSKRHEHFLDKEAGGHELANNGGHILDSISTVVGELDHDSHSDLIGNSMT